MRLSEIIPALQKVIRLVEFADFRALSHVLPQFPTFSQFPALLHVIAHFRSVSHIFARFRAFSRDYETQRVALCALTISGRAGLSVEI